MWQLNILNALYSQESVEDVSAIEVVEEVFVSNQTEMFEEVRKCAKQERSLFDWLNTTRIAHSNITHLH